ncbi:DUF1385 domain-containing protein [uncultured Tyzzerella sp.]|uniref:DUF1385 domain-containing protein n=1 Tax=uncultured Tyzzerella sp. TaxID=2321398 RepID=UPI002943A694|nr:DUF1385 domain-containing protein [uncultured Tyzzerella sp.]
MSDKKCEIIAKSIGGQAVIEGVMMRGKSMYCMAVRNVNTKEIAIEKDKVKYLGSRAKILKLPFIRGIASFVDSLVLGMKIIMKSATLSGIDEDVENEEKSKLDIWLKNKFGEKLTDYIIYFSVFISIILSIGIFMVLPVWVSSFIAKFFKVSLSGIGVVEGIVRILIFLGYIFIISKMKDVQRLFKYHGAEHKTINCFESGDDLTIENVKKHTRLHKRCGTSFLIIVMIVSMIVFMFLRTDNVTLRVLSRVILVPFIAGISYEIIKLAGKCDNIFVKIISAPGMALQKVTTKEPEDEMIETAILSLKGVLEEEGSYDE